MKKYIGTKQIEAEPMTMGVAYEKGLLQAGRVPNENEKSNAGYHVRYQDGYESWSPAEPFDKAYRVADTALDRMLIEGEELTIKIEKLHNYTESNKFLELDEQTRAMLLAQLKAMREYQQLLNVRYIRMENGKGRLEGLGFSAAVELLRRGFAVRRASWNSNLFVVKQIPAHIGKDIIPKMQSLPQSAKYLLMANTGFIDYMDQCIIIDKGIGQANSWSPSVCDVFAEDWALAD